MYTIDKELRKTIQDIMDSELKFQPIGHHDLGRHFVYSFKDRNDDEFILKIYGKENSCCKERVSLNLLKGKIPCPEFIDNGKLNNGTEWIVMNKLDGVVLETVWDELTEENRKEILEKLGEVLSIIHNYSKYNYFGTWKECGTGTVDCIDFIDHRKTKDKQLIDKIIKQDLPEQDFFMRGYKELIKYYDDLYIQENTSMCHHDYSPRNTIVVKKNGKWEVSGIIDFEHCCPNDPDIDFTDYYQNIFIHNPQYENYFISGYTKRRELTKNFEKKVRYYLLNKGLLICSWAYEQAPDYYKEGIELLKWLLN